MQKNSISRKPEKGKCVDAKDMVIPVADRAAGWSGAGKGLRNMKSFDLFLQDGGGGAWLLDPLLHTILKVRLSIHSLRLHSNFVQTGLLDR